MRVWFFAWEAMWGMILTLDQMKRIGMPLGSRCYILIHCAFVGILWAAGFFYIWDELGDGWNRHYVRMSWKRAWLSAFVSFFRGREIEGHLKLWKIWNDRSNFFVCGFLEYVRRLAKETSTFMMNFVDWFGSK